MLLRNGILACALLVLLTACDEPKITAYRVAKEVRSASAPDGSPGHAHGAASERQRPKVTFTLPQGWKEVPLGPVNSAAFVISGEGGKNADVSVAALPFLAGRETDIVNLWRAQLGLEELTPEQAREQLKDLKINDEDGKTFEVSSGTAADAQKIVTVMVHRPGASWFYKLSGDTSAVEKERATFLEFVKSVKPVEGTAEEPEPQELLGHAPSDWKALPVGNMQLAKFSVPEVQGATGQVSVSVFDSDTGGTLANVNRWRRQIGLNHLDEQQLSGALAPLDPKVPGAVLVDMTNSTQQLLGAIVPRGSMWFFYKLTGNPPAVSAQKDAFVRFAAAHPAHE